MNGRLFKYFQVIKTFHLQIVMKESIPIMRNQNIYAIFWTNLIELIMQAKHQWKELLAYVKLHASNEIRIQHV